VPPRLPPEKYPFSLKGSLPSFEQLASGGMNGEDTKNFDLGGFRIYRPKAFKRA
jgi:hypothetical protein